MAAVAVICKLGSLLDFILIFVWQGIKSLPGRSLHLRNQTKAPDRIHITFDGNQTQNKCPASCCCRSRSRCPCQQQQKFNFRFIFVSLKFLGCLCSAFVVAQRFLCPGLAATPATAAAPAIRPRARHAHQMPNAKEPSEPQSLDLPTKTTDSRQAAARAGAAAAASAGGAVSPALMARCTYRSHWLLAVGCYTWATRPHTQILWPTLAPLATLSLHVCVCVSVWGLALYFVTGNYISP